MRENTAIILGIIACILIPACSALDIVSTTSVTWDPLQYIGGEKVHVIYVADPTICPHMQSDIIPNRIQMEKEFIRHADMFVAINGSVDRQYVMPYVVDFMAANGYGTVKWTTLDNPSMTWNTPAGAKALADETAGWLIAADPANESYYRSRLAEYHAAIDAADLTPGERKVIAGQDAVVMVWQKEAAGDWLGLNIVTVFAPEFYEGGKFTPVKIVDYINNDTGKYRNVRYVIENMQSGEVAKGIHEYLNLKAGVRAKRIIFTNFPKSLPGVDSLPDVLSHNKHLVMPDATATPDATAAVPAREGTHGPPGQTRAAALPPAVVVLGLAAAGAVLATRR